MGDWTVEVDSDIVSKDGQRDSERETFLHWTQMPLLLLGIMEAIPSHFPKMLGEDVVLPAGVAALGAVPAARELRTPLAVATP
ncbi:hypothetical protein WISP_111590 [Willisornis vidua]|uniref:Uncharacterized protein n=1 Tax=Willisornis vidua TaxID=1566151 RepID=A0ABQ9D0T3_9PASS|nr:hypothetical protein WISP_111590 [Willisornis vidua]